MTDEDALKFIIQTLRDGGPDHFSAYGYQVYLPHFWNEYLSSQEGVVHPERTTHGQEVSPHFYAAAWELCRRGILRPGVRRHMDQATADGSAGNGYSVTPFGVTWLSEDSSDVFVPTEPERFGRLLARFQARLGSGFQQRAQEAVRCYGAHAYLGCCVMCGAAAESIFLAVAVAKTGDEERVLKSYMAGGGRGRVEKLVIGKAKDDLANQFRGFTTLLKYWRDASGHGGATEISDDEAITSLAMLLRFAHFVDDHWDDLTGE